MNLVLDLDGVLADFAGGYDRLFGGHLNLPEQDIPAANWKKIDETKNFWRNLAPLPGALYLKSLGEIPENIWVLTSRNAKKTSEQTDEWFINNNIDIADGNIIFANPRAAKVEYLERLAPCKFIDDSISNVDFCGTVRGVEATLMLQPYNGPCALKYFPSMDVTNSLERWIENGLRSR